MPPKELGKRRREKRNALLHIIKARVTVANGLSSPLALMPIKTRENI